ncbi:MAG: PLP-dependent aminotransferase family protein [Planctomycetes bacterium]|nr:PLP-dependent aminotransferase family protein [Planctomycetota bacterium]
MLGIQLDRSSQIGISRQISSHIRLLILHARLVAGDALPSTRALAKELGVSRTTVSEAYEMLWSEGFITSRQGSRYRVEENITLPQHVSAAPGKADATGSDTFPQRIRYDFRTGLPDLSAFPFKQWNRLEKDILETVRPGDMLYGDAGGYQPLRRAIAAWLLRTRGVAANADAIFITSGATYAISLAIDVLAMNGGGVAVEDPCHLGIANALRLKNVDFDQVPVDMHGMRVEKIRQDGLSGAYVTPSHQFPLGYVLSAARRVQLVAMARQRDFTIIEDDYDSEYRFAGPPLTPLYSLAADQVFYIGTFSKTLFPALRIGYAVVPPRFHHAWLERRHYTDVQNPLVEQAVLSAFLDQRMMDKHMKRPTALYSRKRQLLIDALADHIPHAAVLGDGAGMHLAIKVEGLVFGEEFEKTCRNHGLYLTSCSRYASTRDYDDTLLLGYGAVEEKSIVPGIGLLARMISKS